MKWTEATKRPSLSTNFETNSSGCNTVCGRVVMMEAKNNVLTWIGTKKINKMGNNANLRAATNKALNEVTPTALQQRTGVASINLPVKLINKASTLTGTIETSALVVKSTPPSALANPKNVPPLWSKTKTRINGTQ